MTQEEQIALLENKLDCTLLLLKEMVYYNTNYSNDDVEYFIERLNGLYNIDCLKINEV